MLSFLYEIIIIKTYRVILFILTVACTNEKLIPLKNKNDVLLLAKAISLGYIHVINLKKTDTMDLIPIDMTANSLLAMIWDFVVYRYFFIIYFMIMI